MHPQGMRDQVHAHHAELARRAADHRYAARAHEGRPRPRRLRRRTGWWLIRLGQRLAASPAPTGLQATAGAA
jgi:hypothetical protein